MVTVPTEYLSHEAIKKKSYTNLIEARQKAEAAGQEADLQESLRNFVRQQCNGRTPYSWQVDAAEAFTLGLDCTIIAGTGSGKTLAYVMPSFIQKDGMTVIISPLNTIEEEQADQFRAWGIQSVAVNGDTYNQDLHKLTKPTVSHSGEVTFWPVYAKLDRLRSFVPLGTPIYAMSATMSPAVLAEVRKTLHISASKSFHLNLGNDQPNVTQELRIIAGSTDYSALDFIVKDAQAANEIPRALIFVNTGLDIPDVELVIQFGVPSSLSVWLQRAGRAVHNFSLQGRAIMMVEASVLQCVSKKKKGRTEEENLESEDALEDSDHEIGIEKDPLTVTGLVPSNIILPLLSPAHTSSKTSDEEQEDTPTHEQNAMGKRVMKTADQNSPVTRRTGQHLQTIKDALDHWRVTIRQRDYPHCSFTGLALLPDLTLKSIASNRSWKTINDLRGSLGASWPLVDVYGGEVLDLVRQLDDKVRESREGAKVEKHQAKKLAREAMKEEKKAIGRELKVQKRSSHQVRNSSASGKENIPLPGTSEFQVNINTPSVPLDATQTLYATWTLTPSSSTAVPSFSPFTPSFFASSFQPNTETYKG
ncbi:hypothetical protein SERLADRAFT_408840 [Serpula lacrymans var. lacrymans S7.9]|uniref:DNA 3'-5' helicase n=1 Tax=Serpula lacrymans var. lacrymans (strain S7.9) TaxID=578457 RepID=F8P006_SERL9|nr:uncharacterized protein SERLADRAFT_408840 [Serpula lacrymans var. lacrymans S7.9]EGO23433.1 hypothetical protein SERLADRAFT_408840 [Serpula lacrymans var. lacrymans S7.9]